MANAKKCDRCGKFYESYHTDVNGYSANAIFVAHETSITYKERDIRFVLDLCPECMNSFTKWLNEKENNNESISE